MTNREKFINYVKNGGKEFFCSPQIGAGAGFDTMLAGKTWMSHTTMQDTVNATKLFDMVPLFNFGIPALSSLTEEFKEESTVTISHGGKRRTVDTVFSCKKGTLRS